MKEEIKCPQCNGTKFKTIGEETYKCQYCGMTFNIKKEIPFSNGNSTQSSEFSANINVKVNLVPDENDDELNHILKSGVTLEAIKYYKEKTGVSLSEAKKYVDEYCIRKGIQNQCDNGGCAGIIIFWAIIIVISI